MLLICSCFHPRPSSVPAGTRAPERSCGGDRMSGLGNAPVCPVSGSPLFIDLFRNMTKSCSVFDSCTTSLSIVSLSMFSFSVAVLLRRKISAKLIHHFDISKFLTKFFCFRSGPPPEATSAQLTALGSSPKASAKLLPFSLSTKYFRIFFLIIFLVMAEVAEN